MANTPYIVSGIILLLLVLGGMLFLAAQILVKKFKDVTVRKRKLWVWRSFLVVLVIYVMFVVISNKGLIQSIFPGELSIIPTIIMIIFFGSMFEIVLIDILLPDVVDMWKRIVIELSGFVLLCFISFYAFSAGLTLVATMMA